MQLPGEGPAITGSTAWWKHYWAANSGNGCDLEAAFTQLAQTDSTTQPNTHPSQRNAWASLISRCNFSFIILHFVRSHPFFPHMLWPFYLTCPVLCISNEFSTLDRLLVTENAAILSKKNTLSIHWHFLNYFSFLLNASLITLQQHFLITGCHLLFLQHKNDTHIKSLLPASEIWKNFTTMHLPKIYPFIWWSQTALFQGLFVSWKLMFQKLNQIL